ncbi:hypothetical protein OR1_03112 [Geobacter sp. OR-1]|nr:hypothetical protein OR1_03112 [Geobacter sp. OR-1]
MTTTGWEFWSVKFDLLMLTLISIILFIPVWLGYRKDENLHRVDLMAGDEGED